MRFGSEIVRGVRLAAIVFAVALVGVLAYRMVAVDDEPQVSAHPKPVEHARTTKEPIKGVSALVPSPPAVGGRMAPAIKAAPQPKETVLVTVPETQQAFTADANTIDDSHTLAVVTADDARPVSEENAEPTPAPAKPESRAARVFKSVRRFLRLGK